MRHLYYSLLLLATVSFASVEANAQVTIGANTPPQPFSALELISGTNRGLRLPQMSDTDKTAAFGADNAVLTAAGTVAQGLQVFNTDNLCVETWNGAQWISQCMNCDGITFPALSGSYSLCNGDKISDLTAAAGGNVAWYDALTDGNKYLATAALPINATTTFYAEQGIGNCKNAVPRTPVSVTVGDCSSAVPTTGAGITTYTNVMYDFQKQTLEAYKGTGGGIPTTFQWQYSTTTTDGDFIAVPNAPNSAFYTVPVDFAKNYLTGSTHSATLYFRCLLSNPATTTPVKTANQDILFINTTTSGYGTGASGVKYLTLNKAGAPLNVALLNIGQSEGDDAGDLGDFYQWGRIADGHQKTTWSKNASHVNQILPMNGTATSAVVAYSSLATDAVTAAANYQTAAKADNVTPFHQVLNTSGGYRNFISATSATSGGYYQWYNPGYNTSANDNYLWGQSTQSATPAANRYPVSNGNDPCPSGWKVPSRWEQWDIFNGNGTDNPSTFSGAWTGAGTGTDNNWVWRPATNNAAGGALITNANGEILFLPASGLRSNSDGSLYNIGSGGLYWSSTYNNTNYAYNLTFLSSNVNAGSNTSNEATGFSVRCVAE